MTPDRRCSGNAVHLLMLAFGFTLVLGACSADDTTSRSGPRPPLPEETTSTSPVIRDFAGLCAAAVAARSDHDSLRMVSEVFDHGPLHELASAAIEVDRNLAVRRVEAKEAVESDLNQLDITLADVATDLDALAAVTREAQLVTHRPVLERCTKETP